MHQKIRGRLGGDSAPPLVPIPGMGSGMIYFRGPHKVKSDTVARVCRSRGVPPAVENGRRYKTDLIVSKRR